MFCALKEVVLNDSNKDTGAHFSMMESDKSFFVKKMEMDLEMLPDVEVGVIVGWRFGKLSKTCDTEKPSAGRKYLN